MMENYNHVNEWTLDQILILCDKFLQYYRYLLGHPCCLPTLCVERRLQIPFKMQFYQVVERCQAILEK